MSKYGIFEMKKADEIYDYGYKYTKEILEKQKDLIDKWK